MRVTLTYIYHDSFFFEIQNRCYLLFDYWRDRAGADLSSVPDFIRDMNRDLPCYVFISHHHKDHLNKNVFEWGREHPNLIYVISVDTAKFVRHMLKPDSIWNGYKVEPERVVILRPGESFSDDKVRVTAFGSTDIGNSYMVEVDENMIFHAGDLNAWTWKDESTSAEVETELRKYRKILTTIRAKFPECDIVMFPVDSRIGTDYWQGAKEWLSSVRTRYFLPMHFCLGDTPGEIAGRLADASNFNAYVPESSDTTSIFLSERGDRVMLNLH